MYRLTRMLSSFALFLVFLVANSTESKAQDWIISDWQQMADTCCVKAVTLMPNGYIIGIGTDNKLYSRPPVGGSWTLAGEPCCVTSVVVKPDYSVIGAGTDGNLYTKPDLNAPWNIARNACCTTTIATLPNGTLIGRGTNSLLYYKRELESNWLQIPGDANVNGRILDAASTADGAIIGVGTNNLLYYIGADKLWGLIPASGAVTAIAIGPDNTIYGVGTDEYLYRSTIRRVGGTGASLFGVTHRQGTGHWVPFCDGGGVSCTVDLTESVVTGGSSSTTDKRETTNSISLALSLGVKVGAEGFGVSGETSMSATTTTSSSLAVSSARTATQNWSNSKARTVKIDIPYDKYDVFMVWRWQVDLPASDGTTTAVETSSYTCTPNGKYPEYIPGDPEHVANPCLVPR